MALESANFIDGLNASNPLSTDTVSQADDHIRLIKSTIKATFPNVTGAVTKTNTQINDLLEKSGGTMTGALTLSGAPASNLHAATKLYVDTSISTVGTAKANTTTTVTAGAGLTGGGDLSANRTLSIVDAGVTTAKIADANVTTDKIADSAVTTAKIANSAITQNKLASSIYTTGYQSKSASGYQELPGGLKIQWGSEEVTQDAAQTFNFPVAFATACYSVVTQRTTANASASIPVSSTSTTGFTVDRDDNINTNTPFTYIAIGY